MAGQQQFYLGCAVWAYKGWVGEVYPSGSSPSRFLQLYGDRFTAVEGNSSFYAVPSASALTRWVAQTPAGFQFCPKFPQAVTHQGCLQPQIAAARRFQAHMAEHLGDRLGPLIVQLPPRYSPESRQDLTTFLQALVGERAIALEVRHHHWFTTEAAAMLNTLLQDLGVGRVLLDTRPIYQCPDDPQLHSERRKPDVPLQPFLTADFSLVRFISHPQRARNQPYLQEWSQRLDDWLRQGQRIYYFVHCPVEDYSPLIAREFYRNLVEQGAPVPPLPWEAIAAPQQLDLFASVDPTSNHPK
ncbi:MAG: DUF72 domain-containing protein [Spirulinaceae cyanobacterium RM2_2_10]|nr:DUF72 domain-containing protein [Spirulinaceae cyanobacterium SM2_1_0]NJO20964.1 DUF72 domain-containing protein [Spirulinaceae cyanobacterium RM2_2_10]